MKTKSLIHRVALWPVALSMVAAAFVMVLSGCQTHKPLSAQDAGMPPATGTNDVVLREGDEVKVGFPDSKWDSTETVRRDGKITLPEIGDVMAAGKTPEQFRKELVEKYSKEINNSQDISVTVIASAFPVYVMGAVQHPGKVIGDHTLTAVEAIMEAGGYDVDKSQLKSVKVVRTQNGKTKTFIINLKGLQSPGAPVDNFYLQPSDIIIVPQKFVPF